MVKNEAFAPPSLEVARANLNALFDAYSAATGTPVTLVSEIVADDRAFVHRYKRSNLAIGTFDRIVGRFSWLWPEGAAWPADVPRIAPAMPSDKALAKLRERDEKQASANVPPTKLPGDAAWPDDIPMPGANPTENMEAIDG